MLLIRNEQMEILENDALRKFEDDMVQHVQKFAAKQYETMGEVEIRNFVKLGIKRAEAYGFTNRGPVRFFIELMFMFGIDFDSDPQLSWVRNVLMNDGFSDQMEKADFLFEQAMGFIDKVAGAEYVYEKEALKRAVRSRLENLPTAGNHIERKLLDYLMLIYPQKAGIIDQSSIKALVGRAETLAEDYDISHNSSIALFVCLMFTFGHGCFKDPQFSWIKRTLDNSSLEDQNLKIERLATRMISFLNNALSLIEQR